MSRSRNAKLKALKQMRSNEKYFGDISVKNEYGIVDMVPHSVARGEITISKQRFDQGKVIKKKAS